MSDAASQLPQLPGVPAPPRPKRPSEQMKLAAAHVIAKRLVEVAAIGVTEIDAAANDIADCGDSHMDGYDLAKALERSHYWTCDFQMAEELDGFSSELQSALELAEKAWAENNRILPHLPTGTRVRLPSGELGEITGIYGAAPTASKFLVKLDGETSSTRRIVNFEDVAMSPQPLSA